MLFLGNSYTFTNSLDEVVAGLYDDAGIALPEVTRLAEGGYTLPDHVAQIETPGSDWEAAFAQPQDDVVLQDQSQIPGFPQDEPYFQDSAAAAVVLDTYATAAGAHTWFLMTWGRRDGDETNPDLYPDFLTMQGLLADGYTTFVADASADGTPAWLIPAGLAWEQVYRDDPDPTDPSGAFYRLYIEDGSHPSVRGTYLTACVIFMAQTGKTVDVGTVDGVEDAEYLRDVAAAVVLDGGGTYPWTGAEDTGDTGEAPGDTAEDTDSRHTSPLPERSGCGCQSAPGMLGGMLLIPIVRRRRAARAAGQASGKPRLDAPGGSGVQEPEEVEDEQDDEHEADRPDAARGAVPRVAPPATTNRQEDQDQDQDHHHEELRSEWFGKHRTWGNRTKPGAPERGDYDDVARKT